MRFFRVIRVRRGAVAAFVIACIAVLCIAVAAVRESLSVPLEADVSAGGVAVPVLMYHSLLNDTSKSGKYVITPVQFRSDMEYLNAHGYTAVTMTEVIRYATDSAPLPAKPIVITFDDGYYNNYLYAYPILQELHMKGVISIIGRYTDEFSEADENNAYFSHCTWTQLNEMIDSGVMEVQNHSYNLHTYDRTRKGCASNKWESDKSYFLTVGEDILKLQKRIQEQTGVLPNTFTYPFGSYTARSEQLIRELGFSASLSCESGVSVIRGRESLYCIKRFLRPSGQSSSAYFASIGL